MSGLRVWAPRAQRVDVVLGGPGPRTSAPMSRADDGWWAAPAPAPGTDYAFSLDGGPARPDPRSAWQPHGVDGPSRWFDPTFAWSDDAWPGRDVRGAVVYELHVGTFTRRGTLDAAAEHLHELVDLGVDVVELMPLAAFGGDRGWGYDGVGLWAVHEAYGGPRALQRFVDAAHAAGLAVALDVVYNHLGPAGNYLPELGPYLTDAHSTPWGPAVNLDQDGSAEVRAWIVENALRWFRDFHVDALRLDAVHALVDDSPEHLLAELSRRTADLAATLGRPLSLVAESDENDPATVTPLDTPAPGPDDRGTATRGATTRGTTESPAAGMPPRGMTAQWADDVHHAIHALVTGERHGYYVDFGTPEVLRHAMTRVFVHDGGWSTFRGRDWGRPVPPETDGHRFVVCASNHDQVGNRALGDRPSARLDVGGLAIEAALVLCSPFTPMVFMGEEWGASTPWQYFTDHQDPGLAQAVRDGRRAEFGSHGWGELYDGFAGATFVDGALVVPDPQARTTFDASVLDRAESHRGEHVRLRAWYRDLIALRRRTPDLTSGDLRATDLTWLGHDAAGAAAEAGVSAEAGSVAGAGAVAGARAGAASDVLVLHRGAVRVVVNLGRETARVGLDAPGDLDAAGDHAAGSGSRGAWSVLAAWDDVTVEDGAGVVLPPRSVAVLSPVR
ncbi:maltooligosyl trehalose hydrolase [Sediminihabitans luteus]|uniref:Malto-oligosyltrehalose trehalohydrolase n=1 Tax=Sediminihabitans luteus TaxID=1138585 RepID=A0A2M9CQL4_9CELL|nr:alpha-amylase family glycosyl hydrolase [Sediminihabitans luteus]PJJ74121.1 maltooligosyl trehalose hydrolase [Sediminihabitans luteus]GII97963.1 malto-oligosyltrehalose trehalohydrolase [Sediminihabitans luteus]